MESRGQEIGANFGKVVTRELEGFGHMEKKWVMSGSGNHLSKSTEVAVPW